MTPDNLFRNKLENFQRPAPAGAWDKLEQNLDKRKTPIAWMRVAAGIALLAAAAVWVWPSQKQDQVLSDNTKPVAPKNEISLPVTADAANHQPVVTENTKENFTASHEPKTIRKKQHSLSPTHPPAKHNTAPVPDKPNDDPLLAEAITPEPISIEAQNKKEAAIASTIITYSADEVNAKFLKKKAIPQATPEPADASAIQKLIGLAYAAKNSDADIGSLRQKKDEILALNFRNKKGEN